MTLLPMDRSSRRGQVDEAQAPSTGPDPLGERIRLDRRIERAVLLVLFTLFLTTLWQAIQVQQMSKSMREVTGTVNHVQQIAATLQSDLRTSTEVVRGNRVVSCADLAVQAPQVALRLPQCAPDSTK